jgi:hypothetical protein
MRTCSPSHLMLALIASATGYAMAQEPQPSKIVDFEFTTTSVHSVPPIGRSKELSKFLEPDSEIHLTLVLNPKGEITQIAWDQCPIDFRATIKSWVAGIQFNPATLNQVPQWSKAMISIRRAPGSKDLQYQKHLAIKDLKESEWIPIPVK